MSHRCVLGGVRSAASGSGLGLHPFETKPTQGIKAPKQDIDLVGERLKRLKKELPQ